MCTHNVCLVQKTLKISKLFNEIFNTHLYFSPTTWTPVFTHNIFISSTFFLFFHNIQSIDAYYESLCIGLCVMIIILYQTFMYFSSVTPPTVITHDI